MKIRKFKDCEEELHDVARRNTGLQDFGDPKYRSGLRALLEAFDCDRNLSEANWQLTYTWIVHVLSCRLRIQKGWADNPRVLGIEIRRPLIITGFPRTGSTALHKLLAVDTQFQGLEYWLQCTPMTRPPRESWDLNPAYRKCVADLEELHTRGPELRKAHEFVAGEVEGSALTLTYCFASTIHTHCSSLPTFESWLSTQDTRESFLYHLDLLRLIGANDQQKSWLLKSCFYMIEMENILTEFPRACIIQVHRDPLKTIPSLCSFIKLETEASGGVAPLLTGPPVCAYFRKAQDHMRMICQRMPANFFHVDQRQLLSDPLGTVRSIYAYFGLVLTQDTERLMCEWIASNPPLKYGEHKYPVDSWGVTPEQISATFADYRAEYGFD